MGQIQAFWGGLMFAMTIVVGCGPYGSYRGGENQKLSEFSDYGWGGGEYGGGTGSGKSVPEATTGTRVPAFGQEQVRLLRQGLGPEDVKPIVQAAEALQRGDMSSFANLLGVLPSLLAKLNDPSLNEEVIRMAQAVSQELAKLAKTKDPAQQKLSWEKIMQLFFTFLRNLVSIIQQLVSTFR